MVLYAFSVYFVGFIIFILLGLFFDWYYTFKNKLKYDRFEGTALSINGSLWPILLIVFFYMGIKNIIKRFK